MSTRIIARLDVKGPNLVKGIHLEGLRVLGSPASFARHYYENGIDEIFYQDVVASLYGRNSLVDVIAQTAKEAFLPLCVGGGIRTMEDIERVLNSGADKVAINTKGIEDPSFLEKAAVKFGSSTIVGVIETIKQPDGQYLCFTDCAREWTGKEALGWAKTLESLGVGEILLTSVDQEGTFNGIDGELTKAVSESVNIPVIAHGGIGKTEDIISAVKDYKADAVALGSFLHYHALSEIQHSSLDEEKGNREFIQKNKAMPKKLQSESIQAVKEKMAQAGLMVRL